MRIPSYPYHLSSGLSVVKVSRVSSSVFGVPGSGTDYSNQRLSHNNHQISHVQTFGKTPGPSSCYSSVHNWMAQNCRP